MISGDDERALRDHLVEIGRRLWQLNMVAANDGNISVRLDDGSFLTTPTGVSKGFMDPDSLLVVGSEGEVLAGEGLPSSELRMHLSIYQVREDVNAVVHAHPVYATAYAIAGTPPDVEMLPEAVVILGEIGLAPYGTPSTEEVVDVVRPLAQFHDTILLSNHGALTLGRDLTEAYFRMESLEHFCQIHRLVDQTGSRKRLSQRDLAKLWDMRKGIRDR